MQNTHTHTPLNSTTSILFQKIVRKIVLNPLIATGRFFLVRGLFAKNSLSQHLVFKSSWKLKLMSLLVMVMFGGGAMGQTTSVSITSSSAVINYVGSYAGSLLTLPTYWGQLGTGSQGTTQSGIGQTSGTAGGWYGSGTANIGGMSFLGSGNASNGNATIVYQNNTGTTITGFTLSYFAKMFKSGSASPSVSVSWKNSGTLAVQPQGALTNSLTSLGFSDATASISTGVTLTQTVSSLSIADGQYIYIRWIHAGGSSSDNLGWNSISFTPSITIAPEINIKQSTTTYLTASTYAFGNQASGTSSSTSTFTVENTGNATLNLSGSPKVAISGTNASEFTIDETSTASTVAASGTTTFTVTFSPTSQGAKTAKISIANDDSNENPYEINLTGTGTVSAVSDITNTAAYSYSSNVDYASYQTATSLTIANSVGVNGLTIRDGSASTDTDNLGTTLSALTFSTGGSTAIRTAALFDGTTNVKEVAVNGATSIAFTGLSLSTSDGGTKDFELRVTYQSTVIDNQQITFAVSAATAASSGSTFSAANSGAATSAVSSDINRLEVIASALVYSQQPPATISATAVMSPAVALTAKDGNSNTDLDYTSSVSLSILTGSTSFDGTATITGTFSSGSVSFSNLIFNTAATSNKITATSGSLIIESSAFDVTISLPEINIKQSTTSYATASTFSFGNQLSGNSSSATTFTIENIGTLTLNLTGSPIVAISGTNASEFSINQTSTTSTVAASGTTTFTITFSPIGQGAKTAKISISNDDATSSENPYEINLTGIGTVSVASDITNTSAYSYTSNIDYASYQTATTLTTANSVGVNGLTIRDGGATTDTDDLGTTLSALTFSTGGSATIRTAALFDGTTNVKEVAVNGATSIAFTGLSLSASDGGTKDFELRVTYQSTVIDNQQITYTVSAATASSTTSGFASSNAGAAASTATSDINRLEVNISQLVFSQQPSAVNTNVSMSPSVTVAAKDANNNLDLDFTDNVRVSSSGTMTSSPVSIASISGIATFSTLTHTASGSGLTLLAERNNSGAWDLDISSNTFTVTAVSATTDYFRSASTGTWVTAASWESSADGINNWITATLTPTSAANTITIRNGHTLTISAIVSIDQVTVQSGGILTLASGGVATIVNGIGDDIIIQNGGRINYKLAPTYSSSTIRINGGGILSIEVSGLTGAGTGVNASTHIYDDASILQWNIATASPSSANVTFFPNVTSEIPILRFASSTSTNWGAAGFTTVNGKLEIAPGVSITLAASGIKTFKYGVTGAGILTQSSAGQIIFSGAASEIGGTSTLVLGSNGLSVTVDLTVTGTLNCGTNLVSGAGSFTLSSGATLKTAHATGISGSIMVSGTKTFSSAANYEFNGAATGTFTTSPTANTVNDLTINRSAGVALGQNVTVNGTLDLTDGIVTTGANTLAIAAAAVISNAGATTFVNGNLRRYPPTGTVTGFLLPIGDAVNYTPVSIDFAGSVTGTGYLDAVVAVPSAAPAAASGLSQTKYVNRKWTLTNTGITGFTSYAPTFTFVSGDIQGSGTPTAFVIRNYETSAWNATTLGSALATSTSATGQTTFTDFVIGEKTELSVSTQPTNVTICSGNNTTFTAGSTSSPTPSVLWQRDAGTGAGFVNITANLDAGTTYSDFNTNTLSLTGSASGLNGYEYRAVYSNINGSVNSNTATVTVNAIPVAPSGTAIQNFCSSASPVVSDISISSGTAIQWYDAATGGNLVTSGTALLTNTHYYASQTVSGCESSTRLDVTAALNADGTWIGGTSTDWNAAANWCGGVPATAANIVIAVNAGNDLLLDQNRSVGNIDFNGSAKKIILGAFNLQANALSNYSASSYVKSTGSGKLSTTILVNGIYVFPIGNSSYNPLHITNKTNASDVFSVRVVDDGYVNGINGSTITTPQVDRTWDISKANPNAGTGVDLQFNWNTDEVTATIVNPKMNHFNGTSWVTPIVSSTTLASNSLTIVGYTGSFSPFTVGEEISSLPIELVSFHANCVEQGVALTWQTASEHSSAYFEVERSADNQNWNVLETIQGAGNSTSLLTYSILDNEHARTAVYYRLKQVDFDGVYKRYDPISMQCGELENEITTYPNPSSDEGFQLLYGNALGERNIGLNILDARGNLLYTKTLHLQKGVNVFNLYDFEAETGIYFLQIQEEENTTTLIRHIHNSMK